MRTCWRIVWMMLMATPLYGCAPSDSPFTGSNLIRVVPAGRSVSIVNAKRESEAQPWAQEY